MTGEICAAGAGLARGYWGDEARTAERFWFDEARGERLYRTGDLGRYLPDGSIDIAGRSDFQIKVNGYRIEAGEVETRLAAIERGQAGGRGPAGRGARATGWSRTWFRPGTPGPATRRSGSRCASTCPTT